MKQLSNKLTGEIIEIIKIKYNENSVIYQKYEFGGINKDPIIPAKLHKLTTINFADFLWSDIILGEEILTALQTELFSDYVIENEGQNWVQLDRPIRLLVPKKWLVNEVLSKPEYKDLAVIVERERAANVLAIEQGSEADRFIFYGEDYMVAYFFEVSDEDAPIISPYIQSGQIILENKEE